MAFFNFTPLLTRVQSVPSTFRSSPLGHGGGPVRSSPFRRPHSPASAAPLRQTTPSAPTSRESFSEVRAKFMGSPATPPPPPPPEHRTFRPPATVENGLNAHVPEQRSIPRPMAPNTAGHGSALSQLQPSQVRTMREAFQTLDRDGDGVVTREDVADMLNQLGMTRH